MCTITVNLNIANNIVVIFMEFHYLLDNEEKTIFNTLHIGAWHDINRHISILVAC